MGKITKRGVKAAPIHAPDDIIRDDEIAGFGVRIFASGRRSYIVQYRAQGRSDPKDSNRTFVAKAIAKPTVVAG